MTITYKIDGTDIKDYNVYVSASDGLISRPKPKSNLQVNWPDYNGTVVDLSKRLYEPREIELDCFIKAESQTEFVSKCNTFLAVFDKIGTRRLEVFVDYETTPKPLVFEVYLSEEVKISKKWSADSMVGTFSMKLIEPEPIKKVFKYTRTKDADKTVTLDLTSPKLLNIYWGDGTYTYDFTGTNVEVSHNYQKNGTFYIVITGNIDDSEVDMGNANVNATLVWNKL